MWLTTITTIDSIVARTEEYYHQAGSEARQQLILWPGSDCPGVLTIEAGEEGINWASIVRSPSPEFTELKLTKAQHRDIRAQPRRVPRDRDIIKISDDSA